MPLDFPSFCDHFFAFKTAANYVYNSESIELGKTFETKMLGKTPFTKIFNSESVASAKR